MYTDLETVLGHAVTRYDRTRRKPQNPYALGLYLQANERVMAGIKDGMSIEQAICSQFTKGPLRDYVLKFVAKHYRTERTNA